MKKMPTVLTSLILVCLFSLFTFGCAEQKPMQPMDAKMETMKKEPMTREMGDMEKPEMKKDMPGSTEMKQPM